MRARILFGQVTARASRQEIATAIISRTGPRVTQSSWKSGRVLQATRRSIQTSTSEPSPERATHTATGRRIRRRSGVAKGAFSRSGLAAEAGQVLGSGKGQHIHVLLMLETQRILGRWVRVALQP